MWVANDAAFPAGDCRGAASTQVTDAQVASLVTQFDTNMFPKESAAFSVAPARDGTKATIPGDFTGAGNKIVTEPAVIGEPGQPGCVRRARSGTQRRRLRPAQGRCKRRSRVATCGP